MKTQKFDALMYKGSRVVGDPNRAAEVMSFYIPPARFAQLFARLLNLAGRFHWYSPYFEKRGYAWKWTPGLGNWYGIEVWNEKKAINYINWYESNRKN